MQQFRFLEKCETKEPVIYKREDKNPDLYLQNTRKCI